MNKKILLLCKDNSSLSIMAEAVLNKYLKEVNASSAAVKKTKAVKPTVKSALVKDASWNDEYHSKAVLTMLEVEFDLVIALDTVSSKSIPEFSDNTIVIEIEYEDPNYDSPSQMEKFIKTLKMELIPISRDILEL
ncbi:arsenate reductase ArsC [Sulfurimonas sp. SAG-AH-194-C20]|nr:arsenate reductase ArsC [Sulfurimonas sp. SAG-AH-194-C20]MDF1879452.1 arsenate reductase ArsC [Sulfurimonas sp. SAG-AH-194-C20]